MLRKIEHLQGSHWAHLTMKSHVWLYQFDLKIKQSYYFVDWIQMNTEDYLVKLAQAG